MVDPDTPTHFSAYPLHETIVNQNWARTVNVVTGFELRNLLM